MQAEDDLSETLEHAALQEVYAYWRAKAGNRAMPSRGDINPAEIPKSLPYLVLYDVVPETPPRYRYRLMGTRVVGYYGADWTGRYLDDVLQKTLYETLAAIIGQCCDDGRPSFQALMNLWPSLSRYHRLTLPLSDNDRDVNVIMVCVVAEFETAGRRSYTHAHLETDASGGLSTQR